MKKTVVRNIVDPSKRTNTVKIETHKMVKAFTSLDSSFRRLRTFALDSKCVLLLPPNSLLTDIEITPMFLASHLAILDATHRLVTFSYIPGTLQDSTLRLYPTIEKTNSYDTLFRRAEESIVNNSPFHTTTVSGSNDLYWMDQQLLLLHIDNILFYQTAPWAWKEETLFETIIYTISLTFVGIVDFLKINETGEPHFLSLESRQKLRNLANEETVIFKIITLDKIILSQIESFVLKFPLMVRKTSLQEREKVVRTYCKTTVDDLRKSKSYCLMDETRLVSVFTRIIIHRVFPYIWTPSICLLENSKSDVTSRDYAIWRNAHLHNFLMPRHLGLPDKDIPFEKDLVKYLCLVDSVRYPNDKLEYLYDVYQVVQLITEKVLKEKDVVKVLQYLVIKANSPYMASTLEFINTFGNVSGASTNKIEVLKVYQDACELCEQLCMKSLKIEEGVYDTGIIKAKEESFTVDQSSPPLSNTQILSLLNFRTASKTMRIEALLATPAEAVKNEDIPGLIQLLQEIHDENIKLQRFINQNN
ncbi:hypothetical protein EIN_359230 [Entamoeba invadens IP1]|uniref:VPS9 domain-containing protein n=1 Tax=Entamoeba invadens IP1 TaxID=370355 RepID=A0A0A1U7S9_ENTIV|nr:hypothetical protein EIN_359230 [Entamoeba invadens IP1]ELP90840.1 hypothetical protein EIN_359230 [Entamoeba invadens IP1]|eukprot:XP_004257611.1 hypothetical protein EIN_359230 [Entamoeba invadens IP1]